jgi:AcrR family transcriptional regulator
MLYCDEKRGDARKKQKHMKRYSEDLSRSEEIVLRRCPQQARGRQRIHAILDAAEQLFAEIGYEATSTNAIAARAHTSIGSLYQFFSSKEAILQSAIIRYRDQFRTIASTILTDDFFSPPLEEALDRLFTAIIALHATHQGVIPFYIGSSSGHQITQELLDRLDQLLIIHAPTLSARERKVALHLFHSVSQTVLTMANASEREEQQLFLDGLKTMLIAYLNPLLTTAPSTGGTKRPC